MTPEQLKASILQYAMEGKLVKQNLNDISAIQNLKEAREKIKEAIKNKELRKEKYTQAENNGKLPKNWGVARLKEICEKNNSSIKRGPFGSSITKSMFVPKGKDTYKVYEQGNAIRRDINYGSYYITKDKFESLSAFQVKPGDIIVSCAGTIGKTFILPPKIEPGIINQALLKLTLDTSIIDKKFFLLEFESISVQLNLHAKGSAIKNLASLKYLKNKVDFPLPPLEEQKRIVAKIEKLMPLVDEYAESYNRLQKIDNEFEDKLKQSVLQYAMKGKLVKQNLSDESAINNLKEVREEIKQAINNKKLRNEKYLKAQNNGEYPKNWAVARLKEICEKNNAAIKRGPFGSSITKSMFVPKGKDTFKIYEQGNAIRKDINYGSYYITKDKFESLRAFEVKPGDIIISCAGTIGETFIIPSKMEPGIINQALLKLTLDTSIIDKDFFLLEFKSISSQLKLHAKGSAIKNLASLKYLKNKVSFPVPPLEEQKRIVKNVEKIMKAISELSK